MINVKNPGAKLAALRDALFAVLRPFEWVAGEERQITTGQRLLADLSDGPQTWIMPPAPDPGAAVTIIVDGNAAANPLTLDGNGSAFVGGTTLIVDVADARLDLVFTGGLWRY